MNHHLSLSGAPDVESNETIWVVMKRHESVCHDPATNHQTKANTSTQREGLSGDQRTRTNKIHMEDLTRGNNISADSRFPIYQKTLFLLTTPTEEMTTKQDEKDCAVACTLSWVACLMELAQHVCHVVGSLRDIGE